MKIKIDYSKILILVVRAIGILSRFLITFLFTKKISLEFQGEYTLYNTSITLIILLLGLDFYMYSNRYVIKHNDRALFALKNQFVLQLVMYTISFAVFYLLFGDTYFGLKFLLLFFSTTFLDHLAQDFFRLYIVLKKVLLANIILFIKSSLWTGFLVIYLFLDEKPTISIEQVLIYWSFSSVLAIIIGFYFYPNSLNFFKEEISKTWILKGIKVGCLLLVATIFSKIIEYSDRYLIEYFLGTKSVGIYSFLFQLSNLVNVVIFTIYISFIYPNLMESVHKEDLLGLKSYNNQIINKSTIIIVIYFLVSIVFLPIIIKIVARNELYDYQLVFYVLLIGNLFLNYNFAAYYALIALEKERQIIYVSFFGCIINLVVNIVFIPIFGIITGAFSLLAANVFIYIFYNSIKTKAVSSWK
jgi:O-antigen/teichoic acid export membrane protein